MDNGGYNFKSLRDYLKTLKYESDTKIGNMEMWENPLGHHITFSTDSPVMTSFILKRVLAQLGKTEEDFAAFMKLSAIKSPK